MKKYIACLVYVLTTLLVGCQLNEMSASITPDSQLPITETPSLATPTAPIFDSTATAPQTPIPTNTASPTATNTSTPTETSLFPPEAQVQSQCLEVEMLSEWVKSKGIVILGNRNVVDGRYQHMDYQFDMTTGKTTPFNGENESGIFFSASPNRHLMAYNRVTFDEADNIIQDELVIATADGVEQKTIPWENGWVGIPGWLDNQHVVINIAGLDADESAGQKPSTLLSMNPFTGERQILKPNFPGIYQTYPMYDWEGWSVTTYDPTLTRVVYLSEESQYFLFTLWDLENEQQLGSLPGIFPFSGYIPIPRWSPDGARFVVEAFVPEQQSLELFLVNRMGQAEQLTNLYSYEETRLASTSWSPDGRYLAAWLDLASLRKKSEVELVVLDTLSRQITDYCIQIKYAGEGYSDAPPEPIWSPDGTQLIVMDRYDQDHRRVILVDLVQGFAAQIAEDMEPMGWMLAP